MNWTAKRLFVLINCAIFTFGCSEPEQNEYQGYIDGDLTYISSPFSGNIETLFVQEGEKVTKGQPLVNLELEPQQSQYKQALFQLESAKRTLNNLKKGERSTIISGIEAEVAKAESELTLAKARLDRTQTLYNKKLSNKDALDVANTEYNAKQDNVRLLKAKLEEANQGEREDIIAAQEALTNAAAAKVDELAWSLESKKRQATNDGFIVNVFYKKGEFAPASQRLISMLSPSNQYVIFYIPIEKAFELKVNDKVNIDCEGCKNKFQASISYISPQV